MDLLSDENLMRFLNNINIIETKIKKIIEFQSKLNSNSGISILKDSLPILINIDCEPFLELRDPIRLGDAKIVSAIFNMSNKTLTLIFRGRSWMINVSNLDYYSLYLILENEEVFNEILNRAISSLKQNVSILKVIYETFIKAFR